MRQLLFAISIFLPCALAGCVWPPDSTPTGYNSNLSISYNIHRISQRSLSGVESLWTVVSPYNQEDRSYPDSLRYILVNGDTAFRHLTISSPLVYDSAAPYRLDGSANFVTLIFPSDTIYDTSYVTALSAQITSPVFGDTILRTTDAVFGYTTNSDTYSSTFQVTDSLNFYSQPLNVYNYNGGINNGAVDFPLNDMETFRTGTLWADLFVPGFLQSNVNHQRYVIEGSVDLDRIVAYPLR